MVTSKRKLAYDEPVLRRARGNMTIAECLREEY